MARSKATQNPAPPAEQKPADPASPAQDQGAPGPSIQEAEQPPAPSQPAPEPDPVPAPAPVTEPEQQQILAPAPDPVVAVADEPTPAPAEPELSPRAIELLSALLVPVEVEPLAEYAARIEEEAQPLPVCQITHPDARDGGLHIGKYAGIRLVRGDVPAALLSDGSTI